MGEEISIKKIECCRDLYQIDFKFEESGKIERCFVRKDELFAMIALAEKQEIEKGGFYDYSEQN
jgi:hypothetical protein